MNQETEEFIDKNYCQHCSDFNTCLGYNPDVCMMRNSIKPELEKRSLI